MALDRLDALESRIRDLVKLVQELKKKNAAAEEELKIVRQRLAEKNDSNRRWEQERVDINRVVGVS
jgi:chromosome segregation ATPase